MVTPTVTDFQMLITQALGAPPLSYGVPQATGVSGTFVVTSLPANNTKPLHTCSCGRSCNG